IVGWGGTGKTSLVSHWASLLLAHRLPHSSLPPSSYFDWSFYAQGTTVKDRATKVGEIVSADLFIKDALEFFGDHGLAASNADSWYKGEHLAQLVKKTRSLLILDGIEPL